MARIPEELIPANLQEAGRVCSSGNSQPPLAALVEHVKVTTEGHAGSGQSEPTWERGTSTLDSSHRHRVARRQGVRLVADLVDADSNNTRGRPLFEPSNEWIFITLDGSHDATGTMRAGQRVNSADESSQCYFGNSAPG